VVEDCVVAFAEPSWPVLAPELVDVVVPAVPWEPAPVCAEPLAFVEVEAVGAPFEVPEPPSAGLWDCDEPLPFPDEDAPVVELPAPVVAVPAP
jgi:hypothetical protein